MFLVFAKTDKDSRVIRIYHECEGRIEKSFPRIVVWHHEACRVMTNSDPEVRIFPKGVYSDIFIHT